ncbi:MAG TPA: hypothetical protein ENN98_05010 [Desulfurivibrio alkaliphilus]|uniref:Uncharacterized protein n=1 Tax=Desulfurivibrio alkaliphilus TaxID=427923 RepID=A0A7C2TKW1_9BACT|nr:hypothetical protein [Desulfurivibrio alkaliphilus]
MTSLRQILERVGQRKSDSLYEVEDLTLGLDQGQNREITSDLLNSRNYYADIVEDLDEGILGWTRNTGRSTPTGPPPIGLNLRRTS